MVYNDLTILQNIAGTLSCFSCFAVVLTYLSFKSLRSKQYVELVFYVALNDMLAAVGLAVGRTSSSVVCWYEGISSNYNYLSSILWITVISYKLFRLVYKSQKELDLGNSKTAVQIEIYDQNSDAVLDDMRILHLICWGFPFIVTLLPLADDYTYQNISTDDDTTYGTYCALRKDDETQQEANQHDSDDYKLILWKIVSFYLWVWIAVVLNIYLLYVTKKLIKSTFLPEFSENNMIERVVKDTMNKLYYYPLILIFCWLPSTIIDVCGYDNNMIGYNLATLLALTQGFLTSMVFFVVNKDVQQKWSTLIQSIYYCNFEHTITITLKERESDISERNNVIQNMIRKNSVDEYGGGRDSYTSDNNTTNSDYFDSVHYSYDFNKRLSPVASQSGTSLPEVSHTSTVVRSQLHSGGNNKTTNNKRQTSEADDVLLAGSKYVPTSSLYDSTFMDDNNSSNNSSKNSSRQTSPNRKSLLEQNGKAEVKKTP